MAVLPKAKDRVLMSDGEHVVTLDSVEIKRIKSAYPDGKSQDGKSDRLVMIFHSETKDDDGMPEELELLLPPAISKKNKTGKLAMMMVPGLDPDEDDFDPDDLVGRKFSAYVLHETSDSGKVYAVFAKIKPYKANGSKPAPASAKADPFADE